MKVKMSITGLFTTWMIVKALILRLGPISYKVRAQGVEAWVRGNRSESSVEMKEHLSNLEIFKIISRRMLR